MVWDSTKSFLAFASIVGVALLIKERVWVLDDKSAQDAAVRRLKVCGKAVAFLCLGLWMFLPSALNLDDLLGKNLSTDPVSQERLLQDVHKLNDLIGTVLLSLRWALFGVGCWISWNTWFLVRFKTLDSSGKNTKELPKAAA